MLMQVRKSKEEKAIRPISMPSHQIRLSFRSLRWEMIAKKNTLLKRAKPMCLAEESEIFIFLNVRMGMTYLSLYIDHTSISPPHTPTTKKGSAMQAISQPRHSNCFSRELMRLVSTTIKPKSAAVWLSKVLQTRFSFLAVLTRRCGALPSNSRRQE